MKIVNCCAYVVVFRDSNGVDTYFSPSHLVKLRMVFETKPTEVLRGKLPIVSVCRPEIVGLPDTKEDGTIFIVPEKILLLLRDRGCTRTDIVCPGEAPEDQPVWSCGELYAVRRFRGLV